ncbi:hypothetical protein ISF_06589 [Cordyceps fumosorosea ARSEF 2679]|uniref:Uncharacterized protein n=1 Tax=Cordyceps fumosorosea (strain ARSEF 2679) TaxID=1081104 RepID=A0A167RPQ3_CORFA|nr:hypothetical protein ISF_06589 [Cordyceps fumosorosea ARSEF 2679]OAA58806.1 hypothetical protein ISF_06589 [Cordyceps fumosorosea ARSEF 2679]
MCEASALLTVDLLPQCLPTDRRHPQRCDRCSEKGLPCSRPVRSRGSRSHAGSEASEPPASSAAPPSPQQSTRVNPGPGQRAFDRPPAPQDYWLLGISGADDADPCRIDTIIPETSALTTPPASTEEPAVAVSSRGKATATMRRSAIASSGLPSLATLFQPPGLDIRVGDPPRHDPDDPPSERPLLACPFYKFDPIAHFRCFRKYDLRRYSDVKQHILRCHTLGTQYCANCWQVFQPNQEAEWEAHIQQRGCERRQGPEDLRPSEVRALTALEFDGPLSDTSKWDAVWDLLFVGHPRPPSPYMDPGWSELESMMNHSSRTAAVQESLPSLLREQGIEQEAAVRLAARIHDLYAAALVAPTTTSRHRLQPPIDAPESNTGVVTRLDYESFVPPHDRPSHEKEATSPIVVSL